MKGFVTVVIIVAAVAGVVAAREAGIGPFSNSLPVTLPVPSGLSQSAGPAHRSIDSGAWTPHWNIRLAVRTSVAHPNFRVQVELAHNGAQPTSSPYASSPQASRTPAVTVRHLGQGSYQWWARYYDGSAVSRWIPFSSGPAFKVDVTRPTTPTVTSSTNPNQNKVYRSGTVSFEWSSTDSTSGIKEYRTYFGPAGAPTHPMSLTTATSLNLTNQQTGSYLLEVEARDQAGNWSGPSSYRVRLDSTPPMVSASGFSTFAFNPHYTSMTFNYRVNLPSTVRIGIYNQSGNQKVRLVTAHVTAKNELMHYTWKGRDDHGKIVPPGTYEFVVRTTDAFGLSRVSVFSNLQVLDKVIIVSLSQQKLWAYQNGHAVQSTLVTTGNVNCCATPPGLYTILGAVSSVHLPQPVSRRIVLLVRALPG